jgi:hypothetical protein
MRCQTQKRRNVQVDRPEPRNRRAQGSPNRRAKPNIGHKKTPKKKDDGASALVDRAVNPGPRILPQAMNKLQGERAVVNKKYDMSLPMLSRAENEGLKEGMKT